MIRLKRDNMLRFFFKENILLTNNLLLFYVSKYNCIYDNCQKDMLCKYLKILNIKLLRN